MSPLWLTDQPPAKAIPKAIPKANAKQSRKENLKKKANVEKSVAIGGSGVEQEQVEQKGECGKTSGEPKCNKKMTALVALPDISLGLLAKLDIVVMNPPFGTRNKGIDLIFLQVALKLASNSVYSLHKRATREYIIKRASTWGVSVQVLAELRFDIPKMYQFHKLDSKDIEVDMIRFTHQSKDDQIN